MEPGQAELAGGMRGLVTTADWGSKNVGEELDISKEIPVLTLERATTQGKWGYVREGRFSLYEKSQDSTKSLIRREFIGMIKKTLDSLGRESWTGLISLPRINKFINNKYIHICICVPYVNT